MAIIMRSSKRYPNINQAKAYERTNRMFANRAWDDLETECHKRRVKDNTACSLREYTEIIVRIEQVEDGDRFS